MDEPGAVGSPFFRGFINLLILWGLVLAIAFAIWSFWPGKAEAAPKLIWPDASLVITPPARFDKALVNPIIRETPNAAAECRAAGGRPVAGEEAYGCQVGWQIKPTRRCFIIIRAGIPATLRSAILRHERAHCHGWTAAHER